MVDKSPFEPGDIVRIKSGGPAMPVLGNPSNGLCYCGWWNSKRQELAMDNFPIGVLKKSIRLRAVVSRPCSYSCSTST
ncbi:MAG: DUF2158 domain-containing protein [Janthinobacterium lividum]